MKYDVSIIMPAIRTPFWDEMYDTIEKSCKQKTFELVMCGPFALTEKLKNKSNVKMIIDNGSPSRCAQRAAIESSGDLLAHLVDDAHFIEGALDSAIYLYETICTKKDVINLRYTEGENFNGTTMPMQYWHAHYHPPLRYPSIPTHYKQCCHHLVDREYFIEMGGYDCKFEYQNFNLHDFIFRIQHDGGIVYDSITDVTNCNFYPEKTGDHAPIVEAYINNDEPYFKQLYSDPELLNKRSRIELNNWENSPPVWERRFSKTIPNTYEEIL
tara:strand:- start:6189 stop:6998 length:810 start_codon:yes stop_codon:yes gene_type:complete